MAETTDFSISSFKVLKALMAEFGNGNVVTLEQGCSFPEQSI